MKYKKYIWLSICLVVLTLCFTDGILADVGNSFSGGGSSGGSYGGSYGGSGFGSFIFLGGSPFGLIITIIIIAVFAYFKYTQNGGNANAHYSPLSHTPINEEAAIAKVKEHDPNFSADKFKSFVGEVYITLQEAWEAKNWQGVRPFESNSLFNTHNAQIQEYIDMKKTDHMNMQNIREITIAQYKEDANQEVLVVKLYASLLNYVSDDETGKIIEGSDKNYVHRQYRLEFIRTKGVKTSSDESINITNCPNCGAPTKVTSSGECEYCHSLITNGNYGWVLNKYVAWS
ncbi:MAG: Tim44 domain-containing protein [Erysipelotrichia bacterium]|nr:Tim44 domain-containing protein [Erysipelotrichia bacterium]